MGKEAAARIEPGLPATKAEVDPMDRARAREYGLLAALIARAPQQDLLDSLTELEGDATPLGQAHSALATAAGRTNAADAGREHFGLFIGVGRGELLPYASYYLTGFLHERPLAEIRGDLARLGVARASGVHEPEDHLAILFDVMAGLALGAFDAPPDAGRLVFERHVAPWAGRFFADLEAAKGARFYRAVGALGAAFVAIETEAFGLEDMAADARHG